MTKGNSFRKSLYSAVAFLIVLAVKRLHSQTPLKISTTPKRNPE